MAKGAAWVQRTCVSNRRGGCGHRRACLLIGAAAAASISFHSTAWAQTSGPVGPTREEITRPQPPTAPPPSRLEVEGDIERAPCALDNPEFRNIRFTLRDVDFDGLRGVGSEALRPAFDGLIGQEHPVSVLCDIRDRAATILRQAGYIAAVEVPEQRIADGTVRFRVLMAKLVQVRVRGDAGRAERTIAGYLEQLKEQEVFNRYQAERYLLLASDIPGYTVRLALRPAGTAPGEVIGDVTVVRMAGVVDANVQNFGSRELGRWGGLVRGQLFGLTGLGDRTTLALFTTSDFEEQQTVQLGHDFRIGGEGLYASGLFTYAWARPDVGASEDEVEARTLIATAEVGYPFIRRQSHTVRGSVGFDYIDQDVELEDDIDLSRDRLRVAFARMAGEAASLNYRGGSPAEPLWRGSATLELRQGLDIFGASESCDAACLLAGGVPPSRAAADGTFRLLRGSLYGEVRPARRLTFALGVLGQLSDDPLLSFEEFSAGNYTAGRGYDPGALMGDSGVGVQAEIRVGSAVPANSRAIAAEPFVFLDYARVGNEDEFVGSRNLYSTGGGVRASWGDKMRFDVVLAFPLERIGPFDEKPDTRLLVSVTTRLWPWSFR